MQRLVLGLIGLYQRYLSPYKGFRCAHAYLHQGESCSEAVKRLIQQEGLLKSRAHIRCRFQACRQAFIELQQNPQRRQPDKSKNHCDKACDCLPDLACDLVPDLPCNGPCDIGPCDCSG
jgi:putative component of membrane protein insertase Oxa1/YidC/SpoIIIJ protein YidD